MVVSLFSSVYFTLVWFGLVYFGSVCVWSKFG